MSANPSPQRAYRLRFTRTDACGVPVAETTADSRVTTQGFLQVGLSAEVFNSTDIRVVGASGAVLVDSKGNPSLLGFNTTIQMSSFNEAALEMLLGSSILDDGAGATTGGVVHATGEPNLNTVMVEWWPENGNNDACAGGGDPYLHYVLPRVNRWVISGDLAFADAANSITLQGYAQPTQAFAASRTSDGWSAADITTINQNGLLAWKSAAALPAATQSGYDA